MDQTYSFENKLLTITKNAGTFLYNSVAWNSVQNFKTKGQAPLVLVLGEHQVGCYWRKNHHINFLWLRILFLGFFDKGKWVLHTFWYPKVSDVVLVLLVFGKLDNYQQYLWSFTKLMYDTDLVVKDMWLHMRASTHT